MRKRSHGIAALAFLAATLAANAGPLASPASAALLQLAPPTVAASDSGGVRVLRGANRTRGAKILVSTKQRWLWFVVEKDTLLSVPVAVGMNSQFVYQDKKFHFSTPIGRRQVLKKEEDPIWTVPEWHYMEKAKARDLELVRLGPTSKVELEDGSIIMVKGEQVGRVNQFGNFWAFTPGTEIVFDEKIFMPPLNTVQRRVPDALGPYKLDTGNGYLIHGTHIYNEDSIGDAVSHGCVRMDNFDLERLYYMVDKGTPVFIF
jgi:hypothetical protein